MTYSDNLIGFLEDGKDIIDLKNFLRHAETLQSQCDKDFNETQKSIEGSCLSSIVIYFHYKDSY